MALCLYRIIYVFAILATVSSIRVLYDYECSNAISSQLIASQALITSAFQLLAQVMNTSYFPQIKMVYTSDKFHGQVYIPFANWLIMIGTVIVTAVYNNVCHIRKQSNDSTR